MPHHKSVRSVAEKWIERYDKEAPAQARQRLEELKQHGESEAYHLWLRIYSETRHLLENGKHGH